MVYLKYFEYLDFLGKKQKITIASKPSFYTIVGVILSIIIMILILSLIIYFGSDIVLHENPTLLRSDYYDEQPMELMFNKTNFIFTLGLQFPDYSLFLDESIYTINTYLITVQRKANEDTTEIVTPIEMVPCNEYTFPNIPEYFAKMDLKNLYCIKDPTQWYLEGTFGQAVWTYLEFRFLLCVNSTSRTCQSKEAIEKALMGGYIGIFFTDNNVNPKNYTQPVSTFGNNIFNSFSHKLYKDVWIYLKTLKVKTDVGFLFSDMKTEGNFAYDYLLETWDDREQDNFLTVKWRASNARTEYQRSYVKIQDVCASVGGIMKVSLIAGEIITYLFKELLYKDYIFKFFFHYTTKNKTKSTILDIKNEISMNMKMIGESQIGINQKRTLMNITKNPSSLFVNSQNNNNKNNNNSNSNNNNVKVCNNWFVPETDKGNQSTNTSKMNNVNSWYDIAEKMNNTKRNMSNSQINMVTNINTNSNCNTQYKDNNSNCLTNNYLNYQPKLTPKLNLSNTGYDDKTKNYKWLSSKDLFCFCWNYRDKVRKIKDVDVIYSKVMLAFDAIYLWKLKNEFEMLKETLYSEEQAKWFSFGYNFRFTDSQNLEAEVFKIICDQKYFLKNEKKWNNKWNKMKMDWIGHLKQDATKEV